MTLTFESGAGQPGAEPVRGEFEISAPPGRGADLVSHFRFVTSTIPER